MANRARTMHNYPLMEQMLSGEASLTEGANHSDWRVRYAAAVAMGESGDPKWLPTLLALMRREQLRDLYSQPRVVGFEGSYDDTRMAEQLQRIQVIWDQPYAEALQEDWRCRGRVLQACLFAIDAIGEAQHSGAVGADLLAYLHELLTHGDNTVRAAAARALIRVGTRESLPVLRQASLVDEWCLQTESRKAIHRIEAS